LEGYHFTFKLHLQNENIKTLMGANYELWTMNYEL